MHKTHRWKAYNQSNWQAIYSRCIEYFGVEKVTLLEKTQNFAILKLVEIYGNKCGTKDNHTFFAWQEKAGKAPTVVYFEPHLENLCALGLFAALAELLCTFEPGSFAFCLNFKIHQTKNVHSSGRQCSVAEFVTKRQVWKFHAAKQGHFIPID